MLVPYNGTGRAEHFGPDGTGSYSTTTYRTDQSNKVTYYFNSLGFRGEEFNPDAPLKLFVSGCSHAFGVGVELEESWPFLFKQKLAEQRGLPASSVNLMNFSQGGASPDYVTRTLLEQSARVRPDVIIAGFPHMVRFELLDETTAYHLGPVKLEEFERAGVDDVKRRAEFLTLGTDEIQQKLHKIKNVLLVQYFCLSHDIPYVFFFFQQWQSPDLPDALSVPSFQPLYEQVDFSALIPIKRDLLVDRAADRMHPGPRTQETLAEEAWKTFSARYG